MKYLSIIALIALSIVCTGTESNAALMKYSFEFEVGAGATFNGSALEPSTVAAIVLSGSTEDIYVADDLRQLDDVAGTLTLAGISEYALTGQWSILNDDAIVIARQSDGSVFSDILFPTPAPIDIRNEGTFNSAPDMPPILLGSGLLDFGTEAGSLSFDTSFCVIPYSSYDATVVPIPNAFLLLSSGVAILIGFRRKFRNV